MHAELLQDYVAWRVLGGGVVRCVSRVACRASRVVCRASCVARRASRVACRVSRVACRVSRVACRVSRVACRVSRVACRVSRPVVPSSTHVSGAFACLQVELLRTRVRDRNTSYERPAPVANVQLSPSDPTRVSCVKM